MWTIGAALLAFVTIAYAVALLLVSAYSSATDMPRSPGGIAIVAVLLPGPLVVGVHSYRNGRRRGLAGDALVRRMSLALVAVAVALFVVLGVAAGPI